MTSRARRGRLELTGTLLGVLVLAPGLARAQAHPNPAAPDSIRHIQTVDPLSGPPGTTVRIETYNLPLQARVHVGVGSIGAGFETLGEAEQGEWGDVEISVVVPDYVTWEKPIYFIAFNAIFSPIGISEPFHVTNDEGQVRRTGTVADGGACRHLMTPDGLVYWLEGDLGDAGVGEEVTVVGTYAGSGSCGPEGTIRVARVEV